MPLREARRRCRGLVVLPPNEALYARASRAVSEVAGRFSPVLEPRSNGRIYLDVTGTGRLFGPPMDLAARLRGELLRGASLDAAVGVAVNKLVSRVAADLIEPAGLLDVRTGDEAPFLAPLAVRRLPGVGEAAARELTALNVRTVRQITLVERGHLAMVFGRFGTVLQQRALGIDPRPVRPPAREPEIRREAVLPEDTNDPARLRSVLRSLVEDAGRELRARGMTASRAGVGVRYSDSRTASRSGSFSGPAMLEAELWSAAASLLGQAVARRVRVRSLRLKLAGLARRPRQPGLFEDRPRIRDAALTTALDRIRKRHGGGAIRVGAAA
jgi:DNA polymerase-4